MGKKKTKNKKSAPQQPTPQPEASRPSAAASGGARWVAVALVLAGGAVFAYALSREGAPARVADNASVSTAAAAQRDPGQQHPFRYFENPEDAHPLPVTLPPSQFRNQGIASTYQIAKEIPEVLAQQPCLCGCDNTSDDHRSLLDCYIDEHASTCLVCMKEAVLAKQMTEAGDAAADIRAAILRHDFSDVSIGN